LTLSSADTHGIAKYARTYIRDTHTHETKRKVERLEQKVGTTTKKQRGGQGRKKEGKKERTKRQGGKRRRKIREKGGERKKKKKKGGGFVEGGRGAWVLRRAGPQTNNARST